MDLKRVLNYYYYYDMINKINIYMQNITLQDQSSQVKKMNYFLLCSLLQLCVVHKYTIPVHTNSNTSCRTMRNVSTLC